MALATGARKYGAEFYQHSPVSATNQKSDGTWEVVTPQGTIHANRVVNTAGKNHSKKSVPPLLNWVKKPDLPTITSNKCANLWYSCIKIDNLRNIKKIVVYADVFYCVLLSLREIK